MRPLYFICQLSLDWIRLGFIDLKHNQKTFSLWMSNKNGLNHEEMLILITYKEPKNSCVSVFQGVNKVL